MMRRQFFNWSLLALFAAMLTACASAPLTREYLDESTAATISIAEPGLIFARDRYDLAVHARDYVTLTPLQINRAGKNSLYLYAQLWTTIDRRAEKSIVPPKTQLALLADDRRIALPDRPSDLRAAGLGAKPIADPVPACDIRLIPVEADYLLSMTRADQLRISISGDKATEYFDLWRGDRRTLQDFLQEISQGR